MISIIWTNQRNGQYLPDFVSFVNVDGTADEENAPVHGVVIIFANGNGLNKE